MPTLHMTRSQREAFLADLHIGLLAMNIGDGAPLITPIWYSYMPGGEVRIVVGKNGAKGKAIKDGQMISLCAQTERPPYQYVTVEGPVTLGAVDYPRDIVEMAQRYLGEEGGRAYLTGSSPEAAGTSNLLLSFTPTTWKTVDYGKR